ncbi:MAG: GNAT family N-acetyltransferase [Porphyrobacter sp.]|nr:GNAT family N-acetyltransferase [Porphyrobacter sp.]
MAVTTPVLQTERLELRAPVASDFKANMAIVSHEITGRYLGSQSSPADHFARFCRNAGSWLLYGYGFFALRLRGEEGLIGTCGVFHSFRGLGPDFDDQPEAGWILRHDQVGRGLALEAMSAVLDWFASEHGRQRIVCMIEPPNEPSIKLAGKLGFTPMREAQMPNGDHVRLFERLSG